MILIDDTDRYFLRVEWCQPAGVELPINLHADVVMAILDALDAAYWRELIAEWPARLPLAEGATLEVLRVPRAERDAWKRNNLGTTGPVVEPFGTHRHEAHAAARSRVDVAGIVARCLGR